MTHTLTRTLISSLAVDKRYNLKAPTFPFLLLILYHLINYMQCICHIYNIIRLCCIRLKLHNFVFFFEPFFYIFVSILLRHYRYKDATIYHMWIDQLIFRNLFILWHRLDPQRNQFICNLKAYLFFHAPLHGLSTCWSNIYFFLPFSPSVTLYSYQRKWLKLF